MVKTKLKKIYFFFGTVAEFGKLTPIMKELQKRRHPFKIVDSGQNEVNYSDFQRYLGEIKPDICLTRKINKSSMPVFIVWAISTFFKGLLILRKEFKGLNKDNSYFIIHGDTVTSTIGAILAKILGLKLIHIEAGYFSGNYLEPFPEEICKNINSRLADVLFPPTDWAKENLKNFKKEVISTKHNTNIESFWWAFNRKLFPLQLKEFKKFYILIIHRQEHVLFRKHWSKDMMEFVIKNSDPSLTCVLLNHPLTIELINSLNLGKKKSKVKIISHFRYPEFISLLDKAEYIATDSATIQQEAYYMGKPFLSLADHSVQDEGLNTNAILSKSNKKIILDFLKGYKRLISKPVTPKIRPSRIVVDYLLKS